MIRRLLWHCGFFYRSVQFLLYLVAEPDDLYNHPAVPVEYGGLGNAAALSKDKFGQIVFRKGDLIIDLCARHKLGNLCPVLRAANIEADNNKIFRAVFSSKSIEMRNLLPARCAVRSAPQKLGRRWTHSPALYDRLQAKLPAAFAAD